MNRNSFKNNKLGIMSPGSMGHAIARELQTLGHVTVAALDGRSSRTRELAAQAGIADVCSLARLAECDIILSVMNPGSALAFAQELAATIKATGHKPLVVDCNAIAPGTMHAIRDVIEGAGAACVDGAVMGQPPAPGKPSRLFVAGEHAQRVAALATPNFSITVVSARIGDASAVKVLDAVMSKGVTALMSQMLVAAHRLGVEDALQAQCEGSRRYFYDWLLRTLPIMPPKSYRWAPEVEEIARTLESAGVPGSMMRASAAWYEAVARTPLGRETSEEREAQNRSGEDVAAQLVSSLAKFAAR
jgi:3-hydroxyisobutyrate dehydrogenase-like beta-hydroxyacid dehydrogenase